MKKTIIIMLFLFSTQLEAQPLFSDKGHPEHFIAGAVIGGVTSYLVFRKTDNKLVSWLVGAGTASVLGLVKEIVDPLWFDKNRSFDDFAYTVAGAVIGASIVIPLKRKKPKVKPNFEAAFNQLPILPGSMLKIP